MPVSPHARYPVADSTISYPYDSSFFILSCTIGFSIIPVFMAGAMILGHFAGMIVVLSISSAIPPAILPIILADAGATMNTSALFASATCSTLNWKFLSNVSTRHLLPVSVSNVIGLIKFVAFSVMMTCTSACFFTSILARLAILYAAMLPVTPRTTVFPFNILCILSFLQRLYSITQL